VQSFAIPPLKAQEYTAVALEVTSG